MAYARPNTFLGIALTKQQRYNKAASKAEKNKVEYLKCKSRVLNKGQIPYPEDPKGSCKTDWKQWQKWRGKKGERALKLAERLEAQGKLEPNLAVELRALQTEAQNETATSLASTFEPSAEFEQMTDEDLALATEVDTGTNWVLVGGVGLTLLALAAGAVYALKK